MLNKNQVKRADSLQKRLEINEINQDKVIKEAAYLAALETIGSLKSAYDEIRVKAAITRKSPACDIAQARRASKVVTRQMTANERLAYQA